MKSIPEKPSRSLLLIAILLLLLGTVLAAQAQDGVLPLPGENPTMTVRLLNKTQALIRLKYNFGLSVSMDDDWMITGSSHGREGVNVHFYQRDANNQWAEQTTIGGYNLVMPILVVLEGRGAIVGLEGDNLHNQTAHRIWAFRRNDQNEWIGPTELNRSDVGMGMDFVFDLDPSGDRLVMVDNSTYGPGEVHFYEPNASGQWVRMDTLYLYQHIEDDVVLEGDDLYISGYPDVTECCADYPDSVDLYQESGGTWTLVQTLVPSNGGSNYSFGSRLAFEGDRGVVAGTVITDPNEEGNPITSGQAYLYTFERLNGSWMEQHLLPLNEGEYVHDLRMSGDLLLVRVNANPEYGSPFHTYLYEWNGSGWEILHQFLSTNLTRYELGDIDGDTLAVSRPVIYPPRDFLRPPRIEFYQVVDVPAPTDTPIPVTATPTVTPPTPTATAETPSNGNLLVNGGFENVLTGWTASHLSGDKIKCNTNTKTVAYQGLCAFRFKGKPGERAVLKQVMPIQIPKGATVRLSGFAKVKKDAAKSKIKLVLFYTDPLIPRDKLVVRVNAASGGVYVPLSSYQPDLSLLASGTVNKVKITLKNQSRKGNIYYDALKLEVGS